MNYYLEDSKEKKILRDAYAGDREAQFEFGRMCLWGDYVDQSDEQAAHWTEQAAILQLAPMSSHSGFKYQSSIILIFAICDAGFGIQCSDSSQSISMPLMLISLSSVKEI